MSAGYGGSFRFVLMRLAVNIDCARVCEVRVAGMGVEEASVTKTGFD